ncbi:MAG: hypothetical protein ACI8X3_002355, partial [Saprospiraceae bacterium]
STNKPTVANSSLNIFPNPSSDIVYIRLENTHSHKVSLEIRDINGRPVFTQLYELTKGQTFNEILSLSAYPKGAYIITLNDGVYLSSKQLILQ